MEWEEIVPTEPDFGAAGASKPDAPLEIIIKAPQRAPSPSALRKEKTQADALARVIRLASHRLHTLALLANASIRNKWLSDTLLHVCRNSMLLSPADMLNMILRPVSCRSPPCQSKCLSR